MTPLPSMTKVTRRVLLEFFTKPGLAIHAGALAKQLDANQNNVNKILNRLEAAGIFVSTWVGRSKVYAVNESSPLTKSYRTLFQQTYGSYALIKDHLYKVSGVEEVIVFGSHAKEEDSPSSDIDLLLIGTPEEKALYQAKKTLTEILNRDLQVVTYTRKELELAQRRKEPFITNVFREKTVSLGSTEQSQEVTL